MPRRNKRTEVIVSQKGPQAAARIDAILAKLTVEPNKHA